MENELRIEEDNYAAGIEWMESQGADIISSSVGYFTFDSTDVSYDYEDLDGKSTPSAIAINRAVSLGVVCVTAAGNAGQSKPSIITPGDADSAITVGAVEKDGLNSASFSSRGPRHDGRLKPDLAALGVGVKCVESNSKDKYILAGGTSLATPLIAGGCGLILSAFPELRPWEIRKMLIESASKYNNPDSLQGYGVPDIYKAMIDYGIIISAPITYPIENYQRIMAISESKYSIFGSELYYKFKNDNVYTKTAMNIGQIDNYFFYDIPIDKFKGHPLEFYFVFDDGFRKRRSPYNDNEVFVIEPGQRKIPCGINYENFPAVSQNPVIPYVVPSITERSINFINLYYVNDKPIRNKINIYRQTGELVYTYDDNDQIEGLKNIKIPVHSLSSGIYFITIGSNEIKGLCSFIIIN